LDGATLGHFDDLLDEGWIAGAIGSHIMLELDCIPTIDNRSDINNKDIQEALLVEVGKRHFVQKKKLDSGQLHSNS
jgi:hypothetical protein